MSKPRARMTPHGQLGNLRGLVRRVVQHLNLEQLARVVDLAHGIDQPVGDVHLVEDGKLDRHPRQHLRRRQRGRHVALVFHVKIHKVIPVPAVDGEDAQNEEVQDEYERLSKRHILVNPPTCTILHISAGVAPKSKQSG